jgi:hypothetical protein
VIDWLVSGGIARERLQPLACGATRPLWSDDAEPEYRAANGRVEIVRKTATAGCQPPSTFDHMHLTGTVGDLRPIQRSPMIDMYLSQDSARQVLETGVTTVRNMGSFGSADLVMRDLINMGAMVGPRMFVSGPGLRSRANVGAARPEVTADGPLEVTAVVRRLIASGVDPRG